MTANSPQSRRPRSATSPTTGRVRVPSTLWALGTGPLDLEDRWPRPVLSRAIGEFSSPGSRVMLIGWPAPTTRGALRIFEPDTAAALAAIRNLDRHSTDAPDHTTGTGEPVDLVIASLLADHIDSARAAEHVTALATEVMAMGALLVVFSRCRHSNSGVLLDPVGSVVAAAQAADLLYLQHIIAAPVTGHTITAPAEGDGSGIPRHTVAHTDVLVFLQPEHG
ncbi:hypothetical protein HGA13_12165 [Nocardia speluncae]|uniref:Class I SAM-dependent methyltransferase n=1 Tax=Nocardia speluncae TaxID=419477 RepID=A0A846XEK5_9NOCA|nr:hypothetical protein [Nocardia speluncae]NKY33827.1 hypothetical protein [Nocardia speluncae]